MISLVSEAILSVDVISGPARSYVILSGPLPVRYSFDKILRRSYLSLYKRNSDIEIAQQLVQQVRAGKWYEWFYGQVKQYLNSMGRQNFAFFVKVNY